MYTLDHLKLLSNRFYTIRYPYINNYKHRELLDKIKKFSYILDKSYPRRRRFHSKFSTESTDIFVHNLHKFFLFGLDNTMKENNTVLFKTRYLTPKTIHKVTEKKSLKRKDEQMYNLVWYFCYDNNFYVTAGSFHFMSEDTNYG